MVGFFGSTAQTSKSLLARARAEVALVSPNVQGSRWETSVRQSGRRRYSRGSEGVERILARSITSFALDWLGGVASQPLQVDRIVCHELQ